MSALSGGGGGGGASSGAGNSGGADSTSAAGDAGNSGGTGPSSAAAGAPALAADNDSAAALPPVDALTAGWRARVAAASAAERAECESRFTAACAAAAAAGAPAPFRGPAADSALGESFLDIIALVSANGYALDARPTRFVCGPTFRPGARRADGILDRADLRDGLAEMIERALRLQAPWLEVERRVPRERSVSIEWGYVERTSLMRAAAAGDERRVRELLAAGAPLRCVDGTMRRTALCYASMQGNARTVAALLEADAVGDTVDAPVSSVDSPLMMASRMGHASAVRALLARGARQELGHGGRAALHEAAFNGHVGVVELLCAAPGAAAALALRDSKDCTPLGCALERGHAACAAVMRTRLAFFERARAAAASMAERAECEARFAAACAAAASAGKPMPFRGPAADSPLGEHFLDVISLVIAGGFALDARLARFLCSLTFRLGARRADGSLDRTNFLGGTADMIDCSLRLQAPWLEAARRAPRERTFLSKWGYVERTTSLMRAAADGDERRVRELLAAGAPLRCVDGLFLWTALHWACDQGNAHTVAALLEADAAGAMVNMRESVGDSGRTPLLLASRLGHEGTVRALLARGARQELISHNHSDPYYTVSALHQAARYGYAGIVKLLCAAPGAQVDALDCHGGYTPLISASIYGHEGAVRALLASGARQDLQGSRYGFGMARTALHRAAQYGHTGVVELLCAAPGAPLDARTKSGNTPLISASIHGHEGAVRALLSRGARQGLQGSEGKAALHWAVNYGHATVVELLCAAPDAEAALTLQDKDGRTPLAIANKRGLPTIAATLCAHGAL
jgi:ankyrin repeat protein